MATGATCEREPHARRSRQPARLEDLPQKQRDSVVRSTDRRPRAWTRLGWVTEGRNGDAWRGTPADALEQVSWPAFTRGMVFFCAG